MPSPQTFACMLLTVLVAIGCETVQVQGRRVQDKQQRFSVDLPGRDWQLASADGGAIVITNPKVNGTLLLLISDAPESKAALDVLGRKLFFGMTDKRFLKREECLLGGQLAAYAEIVGKEDGKDVRVAAYSVKAGKHLYDVVYFAPPDDFEAGEKDFRELAASLQFAKPEAEKAQ